MKITSKLLKIIKIIKNGKNKRNVPIPLLAGWLAGWLTGCLAAWLPKLAQTSPGWYKIAQVPKTSRD